MHPYLKAEGLNLPVNTMTRVTLHVTLLFQCVICVIRSISMLLSFLMTH